MFYSPADIGNFEQVSFNFIQTELADRVFFITLNRPEKRNAFTPVMVNELIYALAYANANKAIWCVVIQAKGPVFCAGMDLNVFQNPESDEGNNSLPELKKKVSIGDAFRLMNKPTVAKVEGDVYAGGFLIVGGCTFVVAAEDTAFSLPEVKRGIFPMQVISTLLDFTSPRQAVRLCILGEPLSARAAEKIGLVSHACRPDEVEEKLAALINTILGHSPYAISKGMDAFRELPDIPGYDRFDFLAEQLEKIRTSGDAQEGINAFKEKRKPVWRNE